jgi:hypothetical protein
MTAYVCPDPKPECDEECYHARQHTHSIECDKPCQAYKSNKCVEVKE